MRRWMTFILLVALPVFLRAAAFEGNIDYEIREGTNKPLKLMYQVKGNRVRMNVEGKKNENAAILFYPSEKMTITLVPDQKMAMKHKLPDAPATKPAKSSKVEFVDTGRKDTVAGQKCSIYTFKDESTEGEACNAEGLGTFFMGGTNQPGTKASPSLWEKNAAEKGLFPLRVISRNLKSGQSMTMVATKIEKKSLPASLFEIPSDYQVMDNNALGMTGSSEKGKPAFNQADFMKKMMNASPEEQERMAEEMEKAFGGSR
ncbi:MAG: hypothetical protein KCHDKBKB_02095 [Elusimicrobia bacterium]|nr:hypothetical protein [Elusimicrobiota bacterium]